jgi:hypothetical protein
MNESTKVLMSEFRIKLGERVIQMQLDVLMDQIQDILKSDPIFIEYRSTIQS